MYTKNIIDGSKSISLDILFSLLAASGVGGNLNRLIDLGHFGLKLMTQNAKSQR